MASLRFSELYSLSWKRLVSRKKQLILPALFGGGMNFSGGGGGSGSSDGVDTMDLQEMGDSLSLIPKAYAQEAVDSMSEPVAWLIIAILIGVFLLMSAVAYTAHLYALHVMYDQHDGVKATVKRSLKAFFPYIGVGLWIFVRSYVLLPMLVVVPTVIWIAISVSSGADLPIPAIVTAVVGGLAMAVLSFYFYPRMNFAGILYLTKQAGIKASVEQSMQKTNGYWGKIVGNSILFTLCQLVIIFVLVFLVLLSAIAAGFGIMLLADSQPIIATVLGGGGILLLIIVLYFGMQYFTFWEKGFQFELSKTIFENPRVSKLER